MLKKILTAVMASAFALALYAPSAMACGHEEGKVAKEEKKDDSQKTADKKADDKKAKDNKKTAKKDDAKRG